MEIGIPDPLAKRVVRATSKVRAVLGAIALDQADLGGGAAHVIADDLLQPETPRHIGGKDRAPRWPTLDEPHREFGGRLDADQPAAGVDNEDGAARAMPFQPGLQTAEIVGHLRPHIGIGADGVEPLELAHLRRDFRRDRDRQTDPGRDDLARPAFVGGVHVGMDEADRHRAKAPGRDPVGQGLQRGLVQGRQLLPLRADPARDGEAVLARDQGRRQPQVQVVLVEAAFGPHLDHVAEALGRDEGRARAAPLDQRIGGQRGAVDDDVQIAVAQRRLGQHYVDAVQDRLFRRGVGGQHLGRVHPAVCFQRDVGEGAADIGAQSGPRSHVLSFAASAASRIWLSVCRGVSASGLMLRSSTAPLREASARAKAAGKSSVRSTRSAW